MQLWGLESAGVGQLRTELLCRFRDRIKHMLSVSRCHTWTIKTCKQSSHGCCLRARMIRNFERVLSSSWSPTWVVSLLRFSSPSCQTHRRPKNLICHRTCTLPKNGEAHVDELKATTLARNKPTVQQLWRAERNCILQQWISYVASWILQNDDQVCNKFFCNAEESEAQGEHVLTVKVSVNKSVWQPEVETLVSLRPSWYRPLDWLEVERSCSLMLILLDVNFYIKQLRWGCCC